MDHVLAGLVTLIREHCTRIPPSGLYIETCIADTNPEETAPESEYLMTLLRDPTSSHLLETLVRRSPERVFDSLWRTYFVGKLARLAVHPVANFVVAKAFERVNAEQLDAAVQELQGVSGKIVSECSAYEKSPRLLQACPFRRECTNRCSTGIG